MEQSASFLDLPPELRPLAQFLGGDARPAVVLAGQGAWMEAYLNPAFRTRPDFKEELERLRKTLNNGRISPGSEGEKWLLGDGRWEVRKSGDYYVSLLVGSDSRNGMEKDLQPAAATPPYNAALYPARDWTRYAFPSMSSWVVFLRSVDWASTSFGPMEDWSLTLRQSVLAITVNPEPRLIIWGTEKGMIYNEAAMKLFGPKHPQAMGQPGRYSFEEAWDGIDPMVVKALQGFVTSVKSALHPLKVDGNLLERYWDLNMLPIFSTDRQAEGCIDEFTEITSVVTGERRRQNINFISGQIAASTTLAELWTGALKSLDAAPIDAPYAMLFQVLDEDADPADSMTSSSDSSASPNRCVLVGSVGLGEGHPSVPHAFPLSKYHGTGFELASACFEAWKARQGKLLTVEDGTLPTQLNVATPGRGFDMPVVKAKVSPVNSSDGSRVLAILVVGLNPMCSLDSEYAMWYSLFLEAVEKAAALLSLPNEQRRAQKIADDIQDALSQQLHMANLEAERSEAKFYRLASSSPTGMFMYDLDQDLVWINDTYLNILDEHREGGKVRRPEHEWLQQIHEDDQARFTEQWARLKAEKVPITVEYRLKRPWRSTDTTTGQPLSGDRWLLATAFPEIEAGGRVTTIHGWVTDISHRVVASNLIAQRLEDALENKRQTERFLDMVSHEIRNPLSAILQSADLIVSTLHSTGMPLLDEPMTLLQEGAEEILDAASTIMLCAGHQKRIVDDVLTMSKLDASLLVISPERVVPPALLQKVLDMYKAELVRSDVDASVCVESSYRDMDLESVVLDPSRLLQVVLNLFTNALKQLPGLPQRKIRICLGASRDRPSGSNVNYVPTHPRHAQRPPATAQAEWGSGEEFYITVAIHDTGKGLSDHEMKLLFQRFQQASPKTYKQYGGSGLGLFISRELCELQGGQIGCASGGGKTTFAFYVMCRRWAGGDEDAGVSRPMSLSVLPISPGTAAGELLYSRRASVASQDPGSAQADAPLKSALGASPLHAIDTVTTAPTPIATTEGPTEVAAKTSEISGEYSIQPKDIHVLIVEDNIINQGVMKKQLKRAGCTVHVANHGVECLDFLERSTFCSGPTPLSVVLLDVEMPVMGGIECVDKIRERQRNGQIAGHVPVIAITANARQEQIAVAMDHGMDRVTTKPFRIPEIMPQMIALVSRIHKAKPH